MYLSKFRLLNYKSFQDSEVLEFKPGINIIVGPNNSGKTALLEALSLKFQNNIHKSITTFPSPSDVINTYSIYELSLIVKKENIVFFMNNCFSKTNNRLLITVPDEYTRNGSLSQSLQDFLNNKNFQDIEIKIRSSSSDPIPFDSIPNFFSSSYNEPLKNLLKKRELENFLKKGDLTTGSYMGFFNLNEQPVNHLNSFGLTIQYQLFQKYRSIIYKFNAERVSSGIYPVGSSHYLEADASNLAEVISNLQLNNPSLFEKFNKYVSRVISTIKWVSAPLSNGNSQVKVWNLDTATQRGDLAYPLSDCGTGISQVLAILYVIITSQEPQIIIIDEPQSFLHPGAAKKLIEIFKEFSQHQYFISTHSAEIIGVANPSTIVKLRYEDGETKTSIMNARDIREQRCLLAELGVSLSDVFGADTILWVEGPTEELCFPLILYKLAPELLTGTKIISIKNTDDLVGGKTHLAKVMFDLYQRLSGGENLFPPVLGFVFDQENRTQQNMDDLKRRNPKRVHFLEKCMYENYLLYPDAIAAILNEYNLEQDALTNETVQKELESNKNILKEKKDAFPKDTTPEQRSDPQYVDKNINAAKLLGMLFTQLSVAPLEFDKTEHSVMLTEWLLKNNPDSFAELVQFLQGIIEAGKSDILT